MRNKSAMIALASFLLIPLRADISQNGFDNQIARIRQLVDGNDLHVAYLTTGLLREQVVSKRVMRVDYVAVRNALQGNGTNVAAVLSNIQNAQDRFRAGDLHAAAQALDLADFFLIRLEGSEDAATRYAAAMRALETDATPATLHYAARAAYDFGRYSESISLVQRELKALPLPRISIGRDIHEAHTLLGLDYAALGNDAGALTELQAAGGVTTDFSFVAGPGMALAAKLLPRHPDEVRAYLDQCSRIQQWPAAAQALVWKHQIERGQTPDFKRQAVRAAMLASAPAGFSQTASSSPSSNIDDQISALAREISAGDYTAARMDVQRLRDKIGRGIRVDLAAIHTVAHNPDRVTDSQVIANLREAAVKANAGDPLGAVSAIDAAQAGLNVLYFRAPPEPLYARAKSAVQHEVEQRGEAQPTTLHEAATLGYRAGQFGESLVFAQREAQQLRKYRIPAIGGWLLHLAHTVMGLDYVALGEDRLATDELKASLVDARDYEFRTGPTMALAKALLAKQPGAVRDYLEECAKLSSWPSRGMAARWKSQLDKGEEPDFGAQAALY